MMGSSSDQIGANSLLDEHPWLLQQKTNQAVGRLKVLKAAWIIGGHPAPQAWFEQNGAKTILLARIRDALNSIDAQHATVPTGLRKAVLAQEFDFDSCMQAFALDWDSAMKRREPSRTSFQSSAGTGSVEVGEQDAETPVADEGALDRDRGTEAAVVAALFGPRSRIRLSEERQVCPRSLLPHDAQLLEQRAASGPCKPRVSEVVCAAASAAGHQAAPAPAFLGMIPEELGLGVSATGCTPSWRTALIVGPSGSGKTSLLRSIYKLLMPSENMDCFYPVANWSPGVAIIEGFEGGFETAQSWLCGVGLSSVPSWCKPYTILPLGEQYRANVARALAVADPTVPVMFDEWTSELDRGVARSVCAALQRRLAARRTAGHRNPIIIFATCHEDTKCFLWPDMVIRCQAGVPPVVEDCRILEAHTAGASPAASMARATFRGIAQPVPSEGTAIGCWRVGLNGKMQEFSIRGMFNCERGYEKLQFALGGASREGTATIRRGSPEQGEDLVVAKHADAKVRGLWLHAHFDKLGIALRVRLLEPQQLVVQTRQEQDGFSDLTAEVKARQSLQRTHLSAVLGEGKCVNEKSGTYQRRLPQRETAISKLCSLTRAESSALQVRATDRQPKQQQVLEQLQVRLDRKLKEKESALEALRAAPWIWGPELEATRVPRLQGSPFLDPHGKGDDDVDGVAIDSSSTHGTSWLSRAGWFAPPDATVLHPGLNVAKVVRCAPSFHVDPRKEVRAANLIHLASYVGEGDGGLSPALSEAACFLDDGFFGLCVHSVPDVDGHGCCSTPLNDSTMGVIIGPSGSGKTSLARERFGDPLVISWNEDAPALAHFHSFEEAEVALSVVALDLRAALRPVKLLSGGERERACLAWALAEWFAGRLSKLIFDEFTSLLDRPLAVQVAKNLNAYAREWPHLKGLVLVTSHQDLVGKGLLEPDWLFDCGRSRLLLFTQPDQDCLRHESKRRRVLPYTLPPRPVVDHRTASKDVELVVRRALAGEWAHFREHHYKDHRLMGQSVCFVGELDGRAVAFTAVITTGFTLGMWLGGLGGRAAPQTIEGQLGYPVDWNPRQVLREHRTVVLPDSQGLGLGSLMADTVAHLCSQMGYVLMSKTAHPTYGGYRDRSPFWTALSRNHCPCKRVKYVMFSHMWRGAVNADGSTDPRRADLLDARIGFGQGQLVGLIDLA